MCFIGVLFVRRTVTDVAVHNDQRRLVRRLQKRFVCPGQHRQIIRVRNTSHVPAVTDKSRHDIFAERPRSRPIQRHPVVVVNPAQVGKPQVSRERSRFRCNAFHQVAVAAYCIRPEIENFKTWLVEICREPLAGNRHSDAVPRTLAQRACGRLDT